MSDENPSDTNTTLAAATGEGQTNTGPDLQTHTRTELFSRARTFLLSPQIAEQDLSSKRKFLVEKGLNDAEVEWLLRELPVQKPSIPPRTYPRPPPSNLPTLLLGIARLFSWIAGGSAALIFIYYRFLLPRVIKTSAARHSIKTHHLSLMRRLTTSLASLKESQAESHSVLPRPILYKESDKLAELHSVSHVLKDLGDDTSETKNIPPVTLIRCGIEEYGKNKEGEVAKPTTEELFQFLESHIPWLVSEDGLKYEQTLWETLSTCPLFSGVPSLPTPSTNGDNLENQKPTRWTYTAPTPPDSPPLLNSLENLSSSLPKVARQSVYQHTLQSLSDFTGYISTQVYMPYRPQTNAIGFPGVGSTLSPAQEDFRKEIRALKGLVLNRRSFMPTIPRPYSAPPPIPTP